MPTHSQLSLLVVVTLLACVAVPSEGVRISSGGRRQQQHQQDALVAEPTQDNATNVDGYEVIRAVINRLHTNLRAESRVVSAERLLTRKKCKFSLKRLALKIEKKKSKLHASRQNLRANRRKYRTAQARVLKLKPMIAKKKKQLAEILNSVSAGDARAKLQSEIARNKTNDANTVLNAANALFAMLSATTKSANKKTPTSRFREELTKAQAQVSDASVMRFLEGTMQSLDSMKQTKAAGPTKEDLDKLRLLLSLARSQIMQFAQSVKGDLKAEQELWSQNRAQLKSQAVLVKREINALRQDVKQARKTMRITGKTIRIENRVQKGAGPKSLKLMKRLLKVLIRDCKQKDADYADLRKSHVASLKLVEDLSKIPFSKDDDVVLDRVAGGVVTPKFDKVDATGKRCCHLCSRAKGFKPCGHKCIRDEETCRSALGCACEAPVHTEH